MTHLEKWNSIVKKQSALSGKKEDAVQTMWESVILPDYLNFDDNDINSQRKIKIGSTNKIADIVLNKNNREVCIIELKRFELHEGRNQLFSYLKQIDQISLGILVCDQLYIYDYHYGQEAENQPFVEIPFKQSNPAGVEFVELFNSDNFNESQIRKWIADKNNERIALIQKQNLFDNNVSKIRKEINDDLIKELLKKFFINEKNFSLNEFETAFKEYKTGTTTTHQTARVSTASPLEQFKNWLLFRKYSENTAYSYALAINRIEKHQKERGNNINIWTTSIDNIRKFVDDYDTKGKYRAIGQESKGTVRNAIKRYYEYRQQV